jgi:hypothetical protein
MTPGAALPQPHVPFDAATFRSMMSNVIDDVIRQTTENVLKAVLPQLPAPIASAPAATQPQSQFAASFAVPAQRNPALPQKGRPKAANSKVFNIHFH